MNNLTSKSIYEFEPGDIIIRICGITDKYGKVFDNSFRHPCKLIKISQGIIYFESMASHNKGKILEGYVDVYGNSGWDYYEDVNINNDAPLFPKISLN